MKRSLRQRSDRRIVLLLVAAGVFAVLALTALGQEGSSVPTGTSGALGGRGPRAYLVATGVYAVPAPESQPEEYRIAEAKARDAGSPLAATVWVDQAEFEQRAWLRLLQFGRIPVARPPAMDLAREVAVLVWPVPSVAPEGVMRAHGLTLDGVAYRDVAIDLRVSASSGGAAPATPGVAARLAPYGLFTIPRNQWPNPAPPPVVPPLNVTLVR